MGTTERLATARRFSAIVLALAVCCLTTAGWVQAQTAGNKAVYTSSGVCCTSSSAVIDASVVSGANICEQIYNALQAVVAGHSSAIVDARGISANMKCGSGETPWFMSGTNLVTASTVLLPAGTIIMSSSPWTLPDGTRLIGEGIGGEGSANTSGTTLQAPSGFSGPMIQMGDGVHCPATGHICHGVSVEDLTLDGEGQQGVNAITNMNSQELSYVSHVKFYQILGTGLSVSGSAQNSGPYTDITFDTGGSAPVAGTACAQIVGLGGTRGIHGLTCISETVAPQAAVYLDSSNNSIEDVIIEGFTDGIRVGSQAAAHSNVLLNIDGDTVLITQTQAPPSINVIHVTNISSVSDLSMMGIRNTGSGFTIRDDLTTTNLSDPAVAMYALGEAGSSGYSRFTTSPNATTWAVGSNNPPTSVWHQ